MFCGKCGAKNQDNAEFCSNCGAKLNKAVKPNTAAVSLPGKNDKNRKVGIIAVAAAAVVIILLGIFLFGGRSYKATIKKYINATFDADGEELFSLIPDKMVDYMLEQDGYDRRDLDDIYDQIDDELEDQIDSLDSYLGEGWKADYEILFAEDIKGDELDDIKDSYEDADVKVSAAKEVEVEFTVTMDETEITNSMDVSLIKVGRSWYLDFIKMGSFF